MGVTAKDRRLLFAMTGPADISIPFSGFCQMAIMLLASQT